METVQQNGRFTLFSIKFPSNIFYSLWKDFYTGIKVITFNRKKGRFLWGGGV